MTDYTITYSRRKTIAIYVRGGKVEVRAPMKTPKREIEKFITLKEAWIKKQLAESVKIAEKRGAFILNYGDTALYRGKRHPITARSGDRVGFDDDLQQFYLPPDLHPERIKAAVIQIYKMLAKRHIAGRLSHFMPLMKVRATGFHITNADRRWGSCSARKSVNFSWRLIMADDDVIDYVVVHELAHITEMNHSARFWAIVENEIPDYKQRQKKLEELSRKIGEENWNVNWDAVSENEPAPTAPKPAPPASKPVPIHENIQKPEPGPQQLSLFDL